MGGIRALGIRGCAVSRPFKEAVIPLADEMAPPAKAIRSVNTIVNDDGRLRACITDYIAVAHLLAPRQAPKATHVVLRGIGGMAKAVARALRDAGYPAGTIVARNEAVGRDLAQGLGYG